MKMKKIFDTRDYGQSKWPMVVYTRIKENENPELDLDLIEQAIPGTLHHLGCGGKASVYFLERDDNAETEVFVVKGGKREIFKPLYKIYERHRYMAGDQYYWLTVVYGEKHQSGFPIFNLGERAFAVVDLQVIQVCPEEALVHAWMHENLPECQEE